VFDSTQVQPEGYSWYYPVSHRQHAGVCVCLRDFAGYPGQTDRSRQETGYCPIRDSSRAIERLRPGFIGSYMRSSRRYSRVGIRCAHRFGRLESVVVPLKWMPVIISENFYHILGLGQFSTSAVEIFP